MGANKSCLSPAANQSQPTIIDQLTSSKFVVTFFLFLGSGPEGDKTASPPEQQRALQPTLSSVRRHKSPH